MATLSLKPRRLSRALDAKGEVERLEKKDLDLQDQEGALNFLGASNIDQLGVQYWTDKRMR